MAAAVQAMPLSARPWCGDSQRRHGRHQVAGVTVATAKTDWSGFSQRRHRMNPPNIFNESELKFKMGQLRGLSSEFADTPHLDELAEDSGAIDRDGGGSVGAGRGDARGEHGSAPDDPSWSPADMGYRKARFFDKCLRADRALDSPRLPVIKTPLSSARGLHEPPGWAALVSAAVGVPGPADAGTSSSGAAAAVLTADDESQRLALQPQPPPQPRCSMVSRSPRGGDVSSDDYEGLSTKERLAASMGDFMSSCKVARIHPATTGIIRNAGSTLKLEYGCLTDRRAQAIIKTLQASSSEVKEALFKSNGLTDLGAKNLLDALPADVERIDLSLNSLGHAGAWCSGLARLVKLRELDVSDSQLGDVVCRSLCEALVQCKKLSLVKFGGNEIYTAARDIGSLVRVLTSLEELELRWNNITGEPARDLIKGIRDNWQVGGTLRTVDLSWNPLGKVSGEETCRHLSQLIAENNTMVHVDISNCYLNASQCAIVAEGLRENRTILGLHISGNEASFNARGFLVPSAAAGDAVEPAHAPAAVVSRARALEGHEATCWICARWQEVHIRYTPGISGPDAKQVWVFTSVDDFAEPTRMTPCPGGDLLACIMAPAGRLRFLFQAGQIVTVSRTAPLQRSLSEPVRIHRVVTPEDSAVDEGDAGGAPGEEHSYPTDVELHSTSFLDVIARELEEPVCHCTMPRRPGEIVEDPPVPPWSFTMSLFAPYDVAISPFEETPERRVFCDEAFAADWSVSRIPSMLLEEDRLSVKKLMRSSYSDIQVLYSSMCSLDLVASDKTSGQREPLTLGMNIYAFTHLLGHYSLITEDLPLAEADAIFVLASAPPPVAAPAAATGAAAGVAGARRRRPSGLQRGGRVVQRHGFMELLLRLALLIEAHASKKQSKKAGVAHALKEVLQRRLKHACPTKDFNWMTVQWRKYVLHTEQVDRVCRKHLATIIDPLFAAYSSPRVASAPAQRPSHSSGARTLRLEGWVALLDALKVFGCDAAASPEQALMDRAWVWRASAMPQIEELQGSGHLELSFVEFMEALARLAALLHARSYVARASAQARTQWDYGMDFAAPACVFIADEDTVMVPATFAECFDRFLSSEAVRQALAAAPAAQPAMPPKRPSS
eukprot:TRINITY_DN24383_c0_g2_i5.p1 TRINITY_DN24383_c0_g2~~TRINITY_DN24383_c0_g2_i5.p1  ORF type:complete len:1121 (-),score=220.63 TRINITY_DN24383_c0_g2_i5:33-3395(-)